MVVVGSLLTSTPVSMEPAYQPPPVPLEEIFVSSPTTTVEALISKIAKEHDISSTTLYNLALSESKLNPDPPGHNDGGLAAGIVQIHYEDWGFTKEEVLDPEFSLTFAAKHIKKGDAYKYWTPLNCYTFVWTKIRNLPRMALIQPNSEPVVGGVAIFYYKDRTTGEQVKHIAYITQVLEGGIKIVEANKEPGLITTRKVDLNDPHYYGTWSL